MSDRQKFALDKANFILFATKMVIIIIGFLPMTGPTSSETVSGPGIFSARRIKAAPVVCPSGLILVMYTVLCKPEAEE